METSMADVKMGDYLCLRLQENLVKIC